MNDYLTNATSNHTHCPSGHCFHLLAVTGNDAKLRCVIGQAVFTLYTQHLVHI